MNRKYKKIAIDFILSFISTIVPIIVLQLLVYPLCSRILGSDEYGLMITIYSLFMLVSNSGGNVISNLRLLHNKKYLDNNLCGDFNILLKRYLLLNLILITVILIIYYDHIRYISFICLLATATIILIIAYISVELRIQLNYKKIVINSIVVSLGYAIALVLFYFTHKWEFIYLIPNVLSLIYLLYNTKLIKEPFVKTNSFKELWKEGNLLLVSVCLAASVSYVDKLVLYPLLGGHYVTIFYTASLLGKMIAMVIGPMSNVILSYLSHIDSISKKNFNRIILIGSTVCLCGYFICLILTRPVLSVLFPQWVEEVMLYVPFTTLTAVLGALAGLIHPFVLKYANIKWQNLIYGGNVIVYMSVALFLLKYLGLYGFCIGGISGALFKIVTMLIIYYKSNKEDGTCSEVDFC